MSLNNNLNKYQKYVPFILRVGLGLVFFVFGIDKLFRPDYWVSWVPNLIINFIPFDINYFMYFQGIIEMFIGLFLIIGLFTRVVSLGSVLITGAIIFTLIFNPASINHFIKLHIDKDIFPLLLNDIMLRDLGLLVIGISLMFLGEGNFLSLEKKIRKWKRKKLL